MGFDISLQVRWKSMSCCRNKQRQGKVVCLNVAATIRLLFNVRHLLFIIKGSFWFQLVGRAGNKRPTSMVGHYMFAIESPTFISTLDSRLYTILFTS